MGILSSIKKAVKKTLKKALSGINENDTVKAAAPEAQMGPAGDTGSRATDALAMNRKRSRKSRGRDSTIITARSEIGSRTLLG